MHGFTFKAIAITCTLLSTAFLPGLTFATTTAHDTKLGCMSCHQGEAMPSDDAN